MNIEKERELFEKWAYENKWNIFKVRDKRLGNYVDDFVNGAWCGWLASRNREGYVLVPVDTLNRTVGHIAIALCHPNNSKDEEDVMHKDLEIIEKSMIGACDD